ncbi:hypothetical protein GC169_06675 [bacterium]|nr:hypothetical protein [bacterium]
MTASRIIGLTLTITGIVLAVWFTQMLLGSPRMTWQTYLVAAISGAMLSVGVRYLLKRSKSP